MDECATESETLDCMKQRHREHGKTRFIWGMTEDGKWFSATVLESFVSKGLVRKTVPKDWCMWTSPQYDFIPQADLEGQ